MLGSTTHGHFLIRLAVPRSNVRVSLSSSENALLPLVTVVEPKRVVLEDLVTKSKILAV